MKKRRTVKQEEEQLKSGQKLPEENQSLPTANAFPIVGIGASAGGLAAFDAFFSAMPAKSDIGMAFILVQHLAPDHKSILTELVRHYTRMQVFEVVDGIHVLPNCAYIIPPNCDMTFVNGDLHLQAPEPSRGARISIDFFFRSLARDLHERAICIVLSGTGSDGSLGVRAVKGEGGMVMAQNPETAEYSAMPNNAIATGLVDYILPPADMPARLIAYVSESFGKIPRIIPGTSLKIESELVAICSLLRMRTGHDFTPYKQNTLIRRIERRMAVQLIPQMDEYTRYLKQNPEELDSLYQDLLIGVTNFFRDPQSFDQLQKLVMPHLFEGKTASDSIRVWVPGCSTGEEAYSIAILLDIPGEICQGRCFKSATHSGGNLPGIPDESLPLVL